MKKFCSSCQKNKDVKEFSNNSYKPDGLNYYCKICHSLYRKKHYTKNKQKYIAKARKFKQEQIKKFETFKATLKCKLCPETESACLDFHHLDPKFKERNLSVLRSSSFDKAIEEVKKCVVLCSNCHRKLHAGIIQLVE